MRFMLCLLLSVFFYTAGANAQSNSVYNSTGSKNKSGGTIYNAKHQSYGGPLSLKNIIRGKQRSAGRSNSSYNPYNLGDRNGNGYALSMTPAQVRAKQAQDRARAAKRARDREQERRINQQTNSRSDQRQKQTNAYTRRFQDEERNVQQRQGNTPAVYAKKKKKSSYVQDKNALIMPQKVFGNIY